MNPHIAGWLGHSSQHTMRNMYARYVATNGDWQDPRDRSGLGPALRALSARLDEIASMVKVAELAAYRAHLGHAVRTVSPLLLRFCEREGLDLDDLASRLVPRGSWPEWLCGVRPDDVVARKTTQTSRRARTGLSAREFDLFAHGGLVVRDHYEPEASFGLRALDRGLEFGAVLSGARVRTIGRVGLITLDQRLPATLVAALPGRPLDQLVDHWLFAGAGCIVERVEKPNGRSVRIVFALEPVPWRAPWARTIGEEDGGEAEARGRRRSRRGPRPGKGGDGERRGPAGRV